MGEPWITNLFGCCGNIPVCCFLISVPPAAFFLHVYISSQVQHNFLGPYCMVFCLGNFGVAFNRMKFREHYGIQGNYCIDFVSWCYCPCCSVMQEYRESIERYKELHKNKDKCDQTVIVYDNQNPAPGVVLNQPRV